MMCVLISLQSSTRVKSHRQVKCKEQTNTHKQTHIMVLTSSSTCLGKRWAAPTLCPCLKGLVCQLAWGRSLTARAAHRRSRR